MSENQLSSIRKTEFIRSIIADILLTLITCGIYNLWVQYRQMEAVNFMLKSEKYAFIPWLLLTFITCGIYHIYHEYRMTQDICRVMGEPQSNEPLVNLVLSVFALSIVADALQQALINRYFGDNEL
ncbi:MAG: DUF4234 domain-containing protein [Bdellovibrionales bacterium]|nr:DUF4234 domain-containing protein [Bdellovibrionales bacterium]